MELSFVLAPDPRDPCHGPMGPCAHGPMGPWPHGAINIGEQWRAQYWRTIVILLSDRSLSSGANNVFHHCAEQCNKRSANKNINITHYRRYSGNAPQTNASNVVKSGQVGHKPTASDSSSMFSSWKQLYQPTLHCCTSSSHRTDVRLGRSQWYSQRAWHSEGVLRSDNHQPISSRQRQTN